MANRLFDSARQSFLEGAIDVLSIDIKLVFVDHTVDIPDPTTDDFLDDIDAGARVATSGNLSGKTTASGIFDADDVVLAAVSGPVFSSVVLYNDTPASEAAKDLIFYIDSATTLPYTPAGADITVAWDNGVNRIFKL